MKNIAKLASFIAILLLVKYTYTYMHIYFAIQRVENATKMNLIDCDYYTNPRNQSNMKYSVICSFNNKSTNIICDGSYVSLPVIKSGYFCELTKPGRRNKILGHLRFSLDDIY